MLCIEPLLKRSKVFNFEEVWLPARAHLMDRLSNKPDLKPSSKKDTGQDDVTEMSDVDTV